MREINIKIELQQGWDDHKECVDNRIELDKQNRG